MTSDEIVRAFADALVALQAREQRSAPPRMRIQTERLAETPNGQLAPFHGSREHAAQLYGRSQPAPSGRVIGRYEHERRHQGPFDRSPVVDRVVIEVFEDNHSNLADALAKAIEGRW